MNSAAVDLLEALRSYGPPQPDPWPRLLQRIRRHAGSAFGRAHDFARIATIEDFRAEVPPMNYEDYRSWIFRAAEGEPAVLACGPVLGFERTSGTSSAAKWIPLTAGLQRDFARGLAGWMAVWRARFPAAFAGRAYWALSPGGMPPETSRGGLPVGVASDAAYFPADLGARLGAWLIVPPLSGSLEALFDETVESLLAGPELSAVSVWSPTFFLGLDAALQRRCGPATWHDHWPKLALVSCWGDAAAATWLSQVRERAGVPVETKGLLATEGVTTLPTVEGSHRVARECHFHEFLTEDGRALTEDQLSPGLRAEVLLSTAGGLYRYRTGDRIEVTGPGPDGVPRLRFLGRLQGVSDLVGEKLHESHVIEALARAGTRGFLLARTDRPGYRLALEDAAHFPTVEALLRENPYFAQALGSGQLAPLERRRLAPGWSASLSLHLARHTGARAGDVKIPALFTGAAARPLESWPG